MIKLRNDKRRYYMGKYKKIPNSLMEPFEFEIDDVPNFPPLPSVHHDETSNVTIQHPSDCSNDQLLDNVDTNDIKLGEKSGSKSQDDFLVLSRKYFQQDLCDLGDLLGYFADVHRISLVPDAIILILQSLKLSIGDLQKKLENG